MALFKVGSRLFTREGPRAVEKLAPLVSGIFLDLKFHDIPYTVEAAVAAAAGLPGVRLMTIHALGGMEMMRAARRALGAKKDWPKLLGVTLLTSLDAAGLRQVGIAGRPVGRAVQLARLAQQAGLDGVVTSAREAAAVRGALGNGFLILVPAVRPAAQNVPPSRTRTRRVDDQARVGTPTEAIRVGADYMVVGRPVIAAPDPVVAAHAIIEEIARALRSR